eukprot:365886-Chlamydomonas_euryale.AAC.7
MLRRLAVASKGIREDLMIRQRERNRQQASGQEKRKAAIAKQRQKMREQRQREGEPAVCAHMSVRGGGFFSRRQAGADRAK